MFPKLICNDSLCDHQVPHMYMLTTHDLLVVSVGYLMYRLPPIAPVQNVKSLESAELPF